MNSLRIICSTFMDWFAHSMRFLPISASSTLLISLFTCAAVDIRLLWRFHAEIVLCLRRIIGYECSVRIHEPELASPDQNTLRGMALSAHAESASSSRAIKMRECPLTCAPPPAPALPHRWPAAPPCPSLPT